MKLWPVNFSWSPCAVREPENQRRFLLSFRLLLSSRPAGEISVLFEISPAGRDDKLDTSCVSAGLNGARRVHYRLIAD